MSASPNQVRLFARNLRRLRESKGWSQSDLARKVWGTTVDQRGYTVARNRDLISSYERAVYLPKSLTIDKIANILGVPASTLLPDTADSNERLNEPFDLVPGKANLARLEITALVSIATALKVLQCLEDDASKGKTVPEATKTESAVEPL